MIDFAAIAPHGDVDLDPELRAAMDELGRRFDASGCESAIVVTPHNVHVEGHFAVVTAAGSGRTRPTGSSRRPSSRVLAEPGCP